MIYKYIYTYESVLKGGGEAGHISGIWQRKSVRLISANSLGRGRLNFLRHEKKKKTVQSLLTNAQSAVESARSSISTTLRKNSGLSNSLGHVLNM